mgnify:CR=1 FL=1|tara:strand:+ start:36 stop:551 length:516 start_codon:yes stop_codon:yes gene_type:complete
MNYDSEWKWNRKRFYLRMKDKEKILNTNYYKGRDIGNIEYVIQKYMIDKEQLPFRISYEFKFYDNKWKVDLYTYNVGEEKNVYNFWMKNIRKMLSKYPNCSVKKYGKFRKIRDENKWYLTNEYRLYLDTIEVKHKTSNSDIKCDKPFFNLGNRKKSNKVDSRELLNVKYNW